jgi:hypothetical protein
MSKLAQFRLYAQQCVQLAERSGASYRDLMLEMADMWLKRADQEQRDAELGANEKEKRHVA